MAIAGTAVLTSAETNGLMIRNRQVKALRHHADFKIVPMIVAGGNSNEVKEQQQHILPQ